jgi:two-component system phosphate regulon sensor histidine kinase PhoR
MDKKKIWVIILLMSISVIGLAIIQFYRIKLSVDLDKQNFEDQVVMALNGVQQRLHEMAQTPDETLKYFNRQNEGSSGLINKDINSIISRYPDNWFQQRLKYEINSNLALLNPSRVLEDLNPQTLSTIIEEELSDQNIDLDYDFGVYSTDQKSFIIINNNYVAGFDENPIVSEVVINHSLHNSAYKINLFNTELEKPGYLSIFFPNETKWLWSSVWPSLLSTILFMGLILFCFAYTVHVIFKQKKVSEMKTDFINNMTHEFKTPIATISLAADSIVSPMISSNVSKVNRFASIIKQENKRMLNQVEKVLQMALLDKKDFELNLQPVDIHETIKMAIEHNNLKIQQKDGIIRSSLLAENPVFEADQTHISNVINNLLDNANKYSPEKPDIIVSTKSAGNGIELTITDKGIGMTKEAKKHIFDRFYRVHTGNRHDVKGFGLGLSYVKAIVTAHHGDIAVKSEIDAGSSFILYFPYKISD